MSQKFAAFDNGGNILGFYSDDIHLPEQIPAQSIPITDTQWQEILGAPSEWKINLTSRVLQQTPPTQAQLLTVAQKTQSAVISTACNAAIVSGFTSVALGNTYTYPSGVEDQLNLSGEVLNAVINQSASGWTTQFKCTDTTGKTAYVTHTAAQMIKVGQDFAAYKLSQLTKNAQLQSEIEAATTVNAVQAITWS